MADDIHIENRDDLEKWLNSLPEDIRRQASMAIASRAALRVLPIIETWLREDEDEAISIVLPTFRAVATPWRAVMWSGHSEMMRKAVRVANAAADDYISNVVADGAALSAVAVAIFATDNADAAFNAHPFKATAAITAIGLAAQTTFDVYAETAHDSTWKASVADIQAIDVNPDTIPALLTKTPLWPNGTPEWAVKLWQSMKHRLLAREGEHWEVWTTWYDARLDPSQRIPCYSPPDLKLEEARVLLSNELWEQGPAAVNARIRELIEESGCADKEARDAKPPDVPEQEPATIEVEWEGDRLIMRRRPVKLGDMPDETLLAALQALRQQLRQTLETLQADQSANAIDRRIIEELRQVVDLLPGSAPVDLAQLIQLAMQVDALRAYMEGMGDDEAQAWPEILRHKVQTQIGALHAFMDRFRVWEVLRAPEIQELTDEEVRATPPLAEEVEQALEDLGEKRADLAISRTLRSLRQRLAALLEHAGSAGQAARERAADLLRGIANILKGIAQWVLGRLQVFGQEFTPAVDGELKIFARWLAKWGRRALQAGIVAAGGWAANEFAWLPSVLEWLQKHLSGL